MSHQSKRISYSSLIKACTLCVCLSSWLFSIPSFASDEQLEGVKKEISRQLSQLNTQKKKQSELEKDLKTQELSISRLSKDMYKLQKEIDRHSINIGKVKREITSLQQQNTENKALLNSLLITQYKQGKHSDLRLFLDQETPSNKDRLSVYAQTISKTAIALITKIKASQQQLEKQQQSISQLIKDRQQDLVAKQTKKRIFTLEREKRKRTLKALKSKVQKNKTYLRDLKTSETTLKKEIATIQKNTIKLDGLSSKKNRLPWPVWGYVVHDYGQAQTNQLKWKGLVIAKRTGTSIQAIADGTVVFADWLRGYGLMLVLDHGKGDMSLYGYNQTLLKKVGDTVRVGDKLALVGDSGGQEQSALYFEIRRKGEPVNPRSWLKKSK